MSESRFWAEIARCTIVKFEGSHCFWVKPHGSRPLSWKCVQIKHGRVMLVLANRTDQLLISSRVLHGATRSTAGFASWWRGYKTNGQSHYLLTIQEHYGRNMNSYTILTYYTRTTYLD
eukprot:3509297-Amphidinium_carterae.2